MSPEGRITKYFLSIRCFHRSVFFKGKQGEHTVIYKDNNTQTYKIYMLVTVIQHLMAIIQSIFLFFSIARSSKAKSTVRSRISLRTHVIQTKYWSLYVYFFFSCMEPTEIREDNTHLYTKTKVNITVKKKKLNISNFCFALLLLYSFF